MWLTNRPSLCRHGGTGVPGIFGTADPAAVRVCLRPSLAQPPLHFGSLGFAFDSWDVSACSEHVQAPFPFQVPVLQLCFPQTTPALACWLHAWGLGPCGINHGWVPHQPCWTLELRALPRSEQGRTKLLSRTQLVPFLSSLVQITHPHSPSGIYHFNYKI